MDIAKFMQQRQWEQDSTAQRKQYLFRLAQKSKDDPDIAAKIGGMLIYNQVIEQCLSDIVDLSIAFIRAEIWPAAVEMDIDTDKATFGKVIDHFQQYATIEPNRDTILSYLKRYNSKRNQVVHDLFDIPDLKKLARELDEYASLAESILLLLMEYEDQIRENFRGLAQRVDFR